MDPFPPFSGGLPEPSAPRVPPPSVQTAVKLMYAGAALSAISLVIGLASLSSVRHSIEVADPTASASAVNAGVDAITAIVVIIGLIGLALWLWMARANRAGKSWARITGTVFWGLDTLSLLASISAHGAAASDFLGALVWLAGLAAVVFLWKRESSAYFASPSGPRGYGPAGYR